MRLILAALVLIVAIASCQAQPQGFAKAEAVAAVPAPVERLTPSERHGRSRGRSYRRRGFGGCSGGGSNNNGNNLSNLIENLDNIINLLNNLFGDGGLLANNNRLGNQAAGGQCIVAAQCAAGNCVNNVCV